MRALRKLVLGETVALPVGVALVLARGAGARRLGGRGGRTTAASSCSRSWSRCWRCRWRRPTGGASPLAGACRPGRPRRAGRRSPRTPTQPTQSTQPAHAMHPRQPTLAAPAMMPALPTTATLMITPALPTTPALPATPALPTTPALPDDAGLPTRPRCPRRRRCRRRPRCPRTGARLDAVLVHGLERNCGNSATRIARPSGHARLTLQATPVPPPHHAARALSPPRRPVPRAAPALAVARASIATSAAGSSAIWLHVTRITSIPCAWSTASRRRSRSNAARVEWNA